MKKIIIFGGVLCLFTTFSANAEISINFGIPLPTYYEAPVVAPAYVAPSYVQYDYGHYRYGGGRRRGNEGRHHEDKRGHR